ncbi:glycosyltransferase family 4 protein [Noviherbaspirillum galbum]|uniref:Glycosyltransferase family 4 protein n=1 Tax=Noviherbaspirillum galbum TaxID=2709383 RepID=A0A6B3SQ12_9BURK|nr:glycosyltransferase family 4 protein [Noviherbaspirillum galbum]NEX62731.1 glycosyltransferase family 4 protein [Noviherbaspirillum galbum]
MRIVIITNHPPPFRIPVYEIIGKMPDVELQVIFCSRREPNRRWMLPPLNFNHVFLKERFVTRGDNFIHNNPDVLAALRRFRPDVIVTTGFNPTYLYAFGYAVLTGAAHVPMTDGTDLSERALSNWHKRIRTIVYSRSQAFLSASDGGQRLYESYGIPAADCFKSCLCIANEEYRLHTPFEEKRYDFIFCGRLVEGKNPGFALEVAAEAARRLGRQTSLLYVGNGTQEDALRESAAGLAGLVQADFHGFAEQEELPALYDSARIFLFPTLADVWGVVANEAAAAGLPIIVSPHAGVVGELVLEGENGYVRALDNEAWTERAIALLTQPELYADFSRRSRTLAGQYTFKHAAEGVVAACRHAVSVKKPRKQAAASERTKVG